ncbi:MAG: AbrB/MazE/SpoVT family DNA-binding domain-containing protein [Candidatus Aenigmatarchaeota archaeon]
MKMISTVRQVGGSLMIRIPKEIVKEENIREGERMEIELGRVRKSYFGVLKGMKPFTQEEEMKAHE